jgi:L-lactate dehydrogenase complex protein LldG
MLGRLRRALAEGDPRERAGRVDSRLQGRDSGTLPALPKDPVATFVEQARAAAAEVVELRDEQEAVHRIVQVWRDKGAQPPLVAAPDPRLSELPWPDDLRVSYRTATAADRLALTAPYAGIAETGSLVMLSGPDSPTLLSFLPDHCLCLIEQSGILPNPEALWSRLRSEGVPLPRALNMITGPSRTADVEQTLQLGAHGPRQLTILLIPNRKSPIRQP